VSVGREVGCWLAGGGAVWRECFVESMLHVAVFARGRGFGCEGGRLESSGFRERWTWTHYGS
jgi:hypothetical protein